MNQLDTYFRALTEYSKETKSNREIVSLTEQLIESEPIKEALLVKRAVCIIDEEWVNEIEKGLVYIEKAIKEERQFILSNGEVIPIEKVKGVSRHSIEHLSRHSNLITRYDGGDDIVPDGLYTVEKLTDYTVYENKFLYMLLCYLRDFISIRYNAILDITNRYDGSLDIEKDVSLTRRNLKYKVSVTDVKKDDEYLRNHNPAQTTIDKISLLLKSVIAYLATPLMQEVAKVAMIKPPIVKTNVLKMNNNFKNAVALYEYIVAYDKLGYKIEYKENKITAFNNSLASDIADVVSLLSFITYEYGLCIEEELKENYSTENDRRRVEELEKRDSQIKALKKKLINGQISAEEYVLLVEKQIRALESEKTKITSLNTKVIELKELVKNLKQECEQLKFRISSLEAEVSDIILTHKERIENLNKQHAEEIDNLRNNYKNSIENLKQECDEKVSGIISNYETNIALMKVECENTIDTLTAEYEDRLYKAKKEYEEKSAQLDKNACDNNGDNSGDLTTLKEDYNSAVSKIDNEHLEKVKSVKNDYSEKLTEVATNTESEVNSTTKKYDGKIGKLIKKHADELEELKLKNKNQINELNKNHLAEVNALKDAIKANENTYSEQTKNLSDKVKELSDIVIKTANINDELVEQVNLLKAQVLAVRLEHGLEPNDNYTDKKSFTSLENQYKAFKKYYNEKWNLVKQNSKKDFFNFTENKDKGKENETHKE